MTVDFVRPNAPNVVSPASAGVSASPSQAQAPIEDASIDTGSDDSFPIGAIIGTAVGGGLLLLAASECWCAAVCCIRVGTSRSTTAGHSALMPSSCIATHAGASCSMTKCYVCSDAVIIVVCCARRQRQAATARKLNAACDVRSVCKLSLNTTV